MILKVTKRPAILSKEPKEDSSKILVYIRVRIVYDTLYNLYINIANDIMHFLHLWFIVNFGRCLPYYSQQRPGGQFRSEHGLHASKIRVGYESSQLQTVSR